MMKVKKVTKAAAAIASTHKGKRSERVILAIIRPNTGDLTRGYQFALQTKEHIQLLGEIALADKFNGVRRSKKDKPSLLERKAVKAMDFAEVLAAGREVCDNSQYTPCRAIALYGEGAAAMVKARDIVKDRMSELTAACNETATALVEVASKAGNGVAYRAKVKAAAAARAAAVKARDEFAPKYENEMKLYRTKVAAALSVIANFAELRNGL